MDLLIFILILDFLNINRNKIYKIYFSLFILKCFIHLKKILVLYHFTKHIWVLNYKEILTLNKK